MAKVQDMLTVENILKEEYLDYFNNNITVDPSPLLEMIKKTTLGADTGRFGSRLGIGGGFGMSAERQDTPDAHGNLYKKFQYNSKDAYVDVQISEKTFRLGQSNRAIMKDAVQDEIDASYEAAKWNVSRMLYGDGTGKLCKVTAAGTGTVDGKTVAKLTVDDTKNLIEGIAVDVYANSQTSPSEGNSGLQIVAIDYDNKYVYLDNTITTASLTFTDGFLTVQNSYNREITGLKSIFDSSVTSIYGVTKAGNLWVMPHTADANHDIDDTKITDAVAWARDKKNTKINLLMCGEDAFRAYEYYMKENNSNVNIIGKRKFIGGATGYEVLCGNQVVTIVRERFVPAAKMWGVDTNLFELRQTGWDFVTQRDGGIFTLMEHSSVHRALLANYMELICKNPGGCIEITNCNATA